MTTSHAIRIHATGGPEEMRWEEVEVGDPGPGEVRIRHGAIGLNFIDVNQRSGAYPLRELPVTLGMEGMGAVEAIGPGVSDFAEGDRVTYCMMLGSYAERRLIQCDRLIKLADGISDETAAAATLKGLTAHRCHGHRHGWECRQGGACCLARLRPSHPLSQDKFCRGSHGPDPGQGRQCHL